MEFRKVDRTYSVPPSPPNTIFLKVDFWNDFSFTTMFEVVAFDERATMHVLPNIKIGFVGQTENISTHQTLQDSFTELPKGYFSLGTDSDFYRKLYQDFSAEWRSRFLNCLKDVVAYPDILSVATNELVFRTSHLRGVSINTVRNQFVRVLNGDVPSTDFHFYFDLPRAEKFAGFNLEFSVRADSKPSTNIHAIIGRNGVGKTTVLKNMVKAISDKPDTNAKFYQIDWTLEHADLADEFFSNLISVAFSAFDPFDLPAEGAGEKIGTPYSYIGLTDYADESGAIVKSREQLHMEFIDALAFCLSEPMRKSRWREAVVSLGSDRNFFDMNLLQLIDLEGDELKQLALQIIPKMSSGHAIIILTLTQLVAKVQEKTLILIDEPESHLHPPLLSAFLRALSKLLHGQNGVAIVATHSPVVLQEIPKSCVWKMFRSKTSSSLERPATETFGENVGTLTREVFRLEVEKSGFHLLLEEAVSKGGTYDQILAIFGGNLGYEARGILRAMVVNRDLGADAQ